MSAKKTIIDVRTPGEFKGDHLEGSINIPLQEIPNRLEEIKSLLPVILCCASGIRSEQASTILKGHGIECENAGSWLQLKKA